ncbi:MAG: antibiotic biosynthesis monooxygenase [Proteobacteria bacterium]|nr:MAG: antibiotic biosynthesis monooxygenase [Pseudomonadota bacterium]
MSVGLVVHLDIKPERFDEFVDIVTRHGAFSRDHEPGCLSFSVMKPDEGEGKLILVETYEDEDALQSHWDSDHMQAYRKRTDGMIINRARYKATVL